MLVVPAREETARAEMPDALFDGAGTPCAFFGLSGFFHPAVGSTGVILCASWGFEDLLGRRSWRHLAELIAAAGYPCLRFDYPGTGDSIGHATDAHATDDWVAAIDAAIEYVRGNAGVRRFVLVGQSLGAALAVQAANMRDDVLGLHLVTPVVDGQIYLRDLEGTSRQAAARFGSSREQTANGTFMGFALSGAMVDSLKAIDLRALDRLGAESVVVYDRLDRRETAQAIEMFRRLGARVDIERVDTVPAAVFGSAVSQSPPVEANRLVAKLAALHPVFASQQPAPARMLPCAITTETFREQPVRFGIGQSLFAVLCRPPHERADTPVVVLLDHGRFPHIGWGRRAVVQARALAGAGLASLRIDTAGIGESRYTGRCAQNSSRLDIVLPDIMAAIDVVFARGHRRIMLAGVSTGAQLALAVAQADTRVTDVVAVDPPRFISDPSEAGEAEIRIDLGSGVRAVTNLIRHRHHIAPTLGFLARRGLRTAMAHVPLRLRAMLPRDPMAGLVERAFADFAARGTRVSLVYSPGDTGLVELRTYFGPNGLALRSPNASVSIIADADRDPTLGDWMIEHMIEIVTEPARIVAPRLSEPREAA